MEKNWFDNMNKKVKQICLFDGFRPKKFHNEPWRVYLQSQNSSALRIKNKKQERMMQKLEDLLNNNLSRNKYITTLES